MKKILSLLLGLSVIFSSLALVSFSVSADETYENFTYKILTDTEIEITGTTSNDLNLDIVIPEKVENRTPIKIAINAFQYSKIKSFSAPTVTTVEESAFDGCEFLEKINLPNAISFGRDTFVKCVKLTEFNFNENIQYIPKSMFWGCKKLEKVTLGKKTETIGDNAFQNCDALISFTIPDSVTTIGEGVFDGCYNLKNIIIPASVKKIGANTFNEYHKDLVLSVKQNSYAENFAKENNLKYKYYCDGEHQFELKETIQPTCTQKGEKRYTCKICDEKKVEYFENALGHKITTINTPSTYFATGLKGKQVCSVCNAVISNGIIENKLTLKKPAIKISAKKKNLTVKCKKVAGATGYQIKYKVGKKTITKNFNSKKALTKTFKKLKKGKCKVQVRAFVKQNGKIAYSAFSSKTIKIK